jgi:hypothetical protein
VTKDRHSSSVIVVIGVSFRFDLAIPANGDAVQSGEAGLWPRLLGVVGCHVPDVKSAFASGKAIVSDQVDRYQLC